LCAGPHLERFIIFKKEIQKKVTEGCQFASIPSGLMADLLDLDFSQISSFNLHGIDLDSDSLEQASELAKEKALFGHCRFACQDAWNLELRTQFDLITSNGLTIYEADDEKVIELYRQFYKALKPRGCLITSFLTPPPTEWDLKKINSQDALMQKIIFADILECKWQVFRSEENVKRQLHSAGFGEIEVIYDDAHIFPTILAKKTEDRSLREQTNIKGNSINPY
jgi:SAM-dependent methyltransferase